MTHLENALNTPTATAADVLEALVSKKQRWLVSVSLEFDQQPVLTWKGSIECISPATAAARAIKEARKTFKGSRPRSWAICLEKL